MIMVDHVCYRDRDFDEINKKVDGMQSYFTEDHNLLIRLDTKFDMNTLAQAEANRIFSEKLDELLTQPSKRFAEFKLAVLVGVAVAFFTVGVPMLAKLWAIWANGGLK